jgi:hypothetical protein
VVFVAALGGCFGGYGTSDVRPGDKSPRLAWSLGVIPGFGAGHRYAGARKTANVLFVTEVVGALFIAKAVRDDTPPEFSSEKGWGYAEFGIVMVLGSLLYDSLGAPAAARKYNRTRRRFDGIITPLGGVGTYTF